MTPERSPLRPHSRAVMRWSIGEGRPGVKRASISVPGASGICGLSGGGGGQQQHGGSIGWNSYVARRILQDAGSMSQVQSDRGHWFDQNVL